MTQKTWYDIITNAREEIVTEVLAERELRYDSRIPSLGVHGRSDCLDKVYLSVVGGNFRRDKYNDAFNGKKEHVTDATFRISADQSVYDALELGDADMETLQDEMTAIYELLHGRGAKSHFMRVRDIEENNRLFETLDDMIA